MGSRKLRRATLTRSSFLGWKRAARPQVSSSAQVFFSPARCVTRSSTRRRADHAAAIFRKVPSGLAALHSFSVPASAGGGAGGENPSDSMYMSVAWKPSVSSDLP